MTTAGTAGAVALAMDAFTAYHNPAGMIRLTDPTLVLRCSGYYAATTTKPYYYRGISKISIAFISL